MLPLWLRRLPHNLSTIRPYGDFNFDWFNLGLGVTIVLDLAPGDEHYLFHFDYAGLEIRLGPLWIALGLIDTPEK